MHLLQLWWREPLSPVCNSSNAHTNTNASTDGSRICAQTEQVRWDASLQQALNPSGCTWGTSLWSLSVPVICSRKQINDRCWVYRRRRGISDDWIVRHINRQTICLDQRLLTFPTALSDEFKDPFINTVMFQICSSEWIINWMLIIQKGILLWKYFHAFELSVPQKLDVSTIHLLPLGNYFSRTGLVSSSVI